MKMKTFTQTELQYSSRWCSWFTTNRFSSRKQFMQIIIYWIPYHPYHLSLARFYFFVKYVHELWALKSFEHTFVFHLTLQTCQITYNGEMIPLHITFAYFSPKTNSLQITIFMNSHYIPILHHSKCQEMEKLGWMRENKRE